MNYTVSLTLKSGNEKTGPIPVSTTSATTCPKACPFSGTNEGGCYAAGGPLAMHWRKVTEGQRGTDWAGFVAQVAALPDGQLWRHNQAGDLPGDGVTIDAEAFGELIEANRGRRGFTYTHYSPDVVANRTAIWYANQNGFTVNLSANSLAHADDLAAHGIGPVVCVLPADATENTYTPAGRKVVVCPATQRDDVSCATCQLCQRPSGMVGRVIVGFPAHGPSKRKADTVARRVIAIKAA